MSKNKRHTFTESERKVIISSGGSKFNKCNKKITNAQSEIEHIIPLCIGGTNEDDNLQVLCKSCHFEKTQTEKENGYIKISETESSFNSEVLDIMNSSLNNSYAFIEKLVEETPNIKLKQGKGEKAKVYHIDINKCRKNNLFYGLDDYCLFTVMDKVDEYKGEKLPGLYYIETESYFPVRGNGWYYLPMINYCLEYNIINEKDIKYVVYSSLSIDKHYYNDFITYIYKTSPEFAKLAINSMIGCFKIKAKEHWQTIAITQNPNEAFESYLKDNGSFINSRLIDDVRYFQSYKSYYTSKQETEAPIYDQIVQIEAIELHRLKTLVEQNEGIVLDLNTDCVSCCFKNNVFPFECYEKDENEKVNLKSHYFDLSNNVPMYKLEDKDRLKCEKLSQYKRNETYEYEKKHWQIINDVEDNDFTPIVETIIKSNLGINIDGCAGAGKSTLINTIRKHLDELDIDYISLAPTNKAAGIVEGETMHKFVASQSRSSLTKLTAEYIFIDEISMIPEYFYKFFIVLKRLRPDIKFILSGDFRQLAPVKDRIDPDYNYKESPALFELADGNRLQLTKCRRSDNELYNLCTVENIPKVKPSYFTNIFCDRHLCFTNKKRVEVNKIMMDKVVKDSNETPLCFSKLRGVKGDLYDENSQDVKLIVGMPIISRVNNKKLNIVNNDMFEINKIDIENNIMTVGSDGKSQEVPLKDFQKLFYVAYCITNHRAQGSTFTGPYSIHEFERYDDKMKYVSLTRATKKSNINIM